jgi:hypothetical protein
MQPEVRDGVLSNPVTQAHRKAGTSLADRNVRVEVKTLVSNTNWPHLVM